MLVVKWQRTLWVLIGVLFVLSFLRLIMFRSFHLIETSSLNEAISVESGHRVYYTSESGVILKDGPYLNWKDVPCIHSMQKMNTQVEELNTLRSETQQIHDDNGTLVLREANFIGTLVAPRFRLMMCTIPKNACSKLRSLMLRLNSDSDFAFDLKPPRSVASTWTTFAQVRHAHLQLKNLTRSEIERVINDESWLKIAVVRNPYTRILSAWLDKVASGKIRIGKLSHNSTFQDYVRVLEKTRAWELNEHIRDQIYMCGFNAIDYTVIAKTETLREDLECISSALNFTSLIQSGWGAKGKSELLKSRTGHETGANRKLEAYYTPELASIVYNRYRADFDAFGYSKQLPL
mmetsp:Transcript_1368/g.2494  ORF Transcript_1368/g.2494 Transcript_1368/m.2494 type:complete len:348 (-) Transcript_1368:27-1070(-)